ncbi:MAG: hypothetical protein IKB19_04040 [Rikenellaceae bacterium]|nr:hypothetical protein [Rikenellaceae bacterium]
MKTYLMNIPKILKGIDAKIDITAMLCDKSWIVFNDEGVKIVYIFRRDGTMLASKSGIVVTSKWEYLAANSSLLISSDNETMMFHPTFIDDVIFALQLDGTDSYMFMIDEPMQKKFLLQTISVLEQYFAEKEQKIKEKEKRISDKQDAQRLHAEQMAIAEEKAVPELKRNRKLTTLILTVAFLVGLVVCIILGLNAEEIILLITGFSIVVVLIIAVMVSIEIKIVEEKYRELFEDNKQNQ